MNKLKKAISVGMSAALLASLLATAVAPAASAVGTVTNIVYQANGAVAGSPVPVSAVVAFASFFPSDPLAAGTHIVLTLPTGTTTSGATCAAANFTIQQSPAAAVAPSTATASGNTIDLLLPAAAIGTTGAAVSIFYTSAAGPCVITNPNTATSNGQLTVAIQGDGSGTLSGISFIAGPPASTAISPAPTATVAGGGGTQQFTATCADAFSNAVPCGTVTWAAVAGTGTGSISNAPLTVGLYTAGNIGTVSVTGTANAILSAVTTVTNTATPPSVACTPTGGTIAAGSTVICTFSPGFPAAPNPTWTQTNFTPAGPVAAPGATFTAVNAGTSPVTGTIAVTGSVNTTFSYTIGVGGGTTTGTAGTVTLSAAQSVPRGDGYTGPSSYTFKEGVKTDFQAGQFVTVTILDKLLGDNLKIDTSKLTLSAPDSLNAKLSSTHNSFTVTFGTLDPRNSCCDNNNIEQFVVSGIMVKAGNTVGADAVPGPAALGEIKTTYVTTVGSIPVGLLNSTYFTGAGTATGTLASSSAIGGTCLIVNRASGSIQFVSGGTAKIDTGGANAETIVVATASAPGTGSCPATVTFATGNQQVLTFAGAGLLKGHNVSEAITMADIAGLGTFPSIGTVVDSLLLDRSANVTVLAGVNNQIPGLITLAERDSESNGRLAKGTVITLTILEAGVVFSAAPTGTVALNAGITTCFTLDNTTAGVATGGLSADRKSATFTVSEKDLSPGTPAGSCTATFAMKYDVASTATPGDTVAVSATAGSIPVFAPSGATSRVNATIANFATATSATPTVYIGENDQQSGMPIITETAAAQLGSTAGSNTLFVCLQTTEVFTRPPFAVVTTGDLKLRDPVTLGPSSSVKGVVYTGTAPYAGQSCAKWTVFSNVNSAVTSVIEIRGSDTAGAVLPSGPTNGPRINVPSTLTPGAVLLAIGAFDSSSATSGNAFDVVAIAIRAYRNTVQVAAVSQPRIPPGAVNAAAGNITISETAASQVVGGGFFGVNEVITCSIQPRTSNNFIQDTLLVLDAGKAPIVSTNGATSGLQAHLSATTNTSFTITVDQLSTPTKLGVITVSNIFYTITADAPAGTVLVRCRTTVVPAGGMAFDAYVSNARIGLLAVADSWIAAGQNIRTASAFGLATVVTTRGSFVTIRARVLGAATSEFPVEIWVKTKTTAWAVETHRRVSTDGYMYYSGRVLNNGYRYYRVTAVGVTSNTVRAYGK